MRLITTCLLFSAMALSLGLALPTPSEANTGGDSQGSFGIGCCGGGDWYWDTGNMNHNPRAVSEININNTNPAWRPDLEEGSQARKDASERVLRKAVAEPCDGNFTSPSCIVWFNKCSAGAGGFTGLLKGSCQEPYSRMGSKEVHEPGASPIEAGADWRKSGSPSIYNIKIWRQTASGGWVSMFERRVGISNDTGNSQADEESDGSKQWFYGRKGNLGGAALFYESGTGAGNDNRAGPLTPTPSNKAREKCGYRYKFAKNGKDGFAAGVMKGGKRGSNICYWEGNHIGRRGLNGLFVKSGSPVKFKANYHDSTGEDDDTEAFAVRWKLGLSGGKISFGIDSPPGYYYIVQIVAMDKREQIMPTKKKSGDYPFTKSNCELTRNRRPRISVSVRGTSAGTSSYAMNWCGNYLQAYMPNPGPDTGSVVPSSNSSADIAAPESVLVGEDALIDVNLKASNLSFNSAVFPRYARLQHFTPQLSYSNAARFTISGATVDSALDKTYGRDYIYYDTDPDNIDRLGAPPVVDSPPRQTTLGTSNNWWMASAQLVKPMEVTPGYNGNGLIATTTFRFNWRAPTVENPCSEPFSFPSAQRNSISGETEVRADWPASPRKCGTGRNPLDRTITNFNAWDDWVTGLVVREERSQRWNDTTPSYGMIRDFSLRCGNFSEYDNPNRWDPVESRYCQDGSRYKRNTWNAFTYTPLADPTKPSPEERANNGSMQFAQGYTVLRAPPCRQSPTSPPLSRRPARGEYCNNPTNWPEANIPRPSSSRGESPFTSFQWALARHQLRWWENASLNVTLDTNRGQGCSSGATSACVRGMSAWARDLTKGGTRILPGNDPVFSDLENPDNTFSSPLGSPGRAPVPIGFEKSNNDSRNSGPNTISGSWELNFCRQALPQNTRLNHGGRLSPNDDTKTPDFLTDKNYGSDNCAGWSPKWKWSNVNQTDTFGVCTANSRDSPTLPPLSDYRYDSNQPRDGLAPRYGNYHDNLPGERSWDYRSPTTTSEATRNRFYDAPYRGFRPGANRPSSTPSNWPRLIDSRSPNRLSNDPAPRYISDCDEEVVGRPDKGYWESFYGFKKLSSDTSNRVTRAVRRPNGRIVNPTEASYNSPNCRFTLPQIGNLKQRAPANTSGGAADGTLCTHIYETTWASPPALWGCQKIAALTGRWNRWRCNYVREDSRGVGQTLLAFGFWYRSSSIWNWFKEQDSIVPRGDVAWPRPSSSALTCHVGSDMPTNLTRDTSLSSSTLRYGTGDLGGSGALFATDAQVSSAVSSHGRSTSSSQLYYSGSTRAWDNRAPGTFAPARDYAGQTTRPQPQSPDYWSCGYVKKGYITNNTGAGAWGVAGAWEKNDPQSGWGLNNSGPRVYTGTDYNRNNLSIVNSGQPPESRRASNLGAGYMVQASFDYLNQRDLINSNTPGWNSSTSPTPGSRGHSDCSPIPEQFYTAQRLEGSSRRRDTSRNSVYSGPGTCWRMLATYQGDISNPWYYGIKADKLDDGTLGEDITPDSDLQAYIRVASNRDTR